MILTIVLSILLFASQIFAFGGDQVGNGGNVVRCGGHLSWQLLDFYEEPGFTPNLQQGVTYREKVLFVLDRLQEINPSRATKYRVWLQQFASEVEWMKKGSFIPIRDTGVIWLPEGCEMRQAAIQRPPSEMLPGRLRYVIDLDLFNSLDEATKAGLILHEIIYREAIESGQNTSTKTRALNRALFSQELNSMPQMVWLNLLKNLSFSEGDFKGMNVPLSAIDFYPSGQVKRVPVAAFSEIIQVVAGQSLRFGAESRDGFIDFHENGNIASGFLLDDLQWKTSRHSLVVSGKVNFTEDGRLKGKVFVKPPSKVLIQGRWREVRRVVNLSVSSEWAPVDFVQNETFSFGKNQISINRILGMTTKDSQGKEIGLSSISAVVPIDFKGAVSSIFVSLYIPYETESGFILARSQDSFLSGSYGRNFLLNLSLEVVATSSRHGEVILLNPDYAAFASSYRRFLVEGL